MIRSTATVAGVGFGFALAIALVVSSASVGQALVDSAVAAVGGAAGWVVLQASRR